MPATTPQGKTFIGIDPNRTGLLAGWGLDAVWRRETRAERQRFARARRADRFYAQRLRRIAQHVADIVNGVFNPDDPESVEEVEEALRQYADLLDPWARAIATSMLTDVMRRDFAAWMRHARAMGQQLRRDLASAPVFPAYQRLIEEQVILIKSLPDVAANRVHELATQSLYAGTRWEDISDDILATGLVTKSRANLIARTETGRASTTFTQVRAQHIGSDGYIWRSALDADVRPQHKRLEGTFHRWDAPPIASEPGQKEMRYHPGAGPNCRCFPEVVLPDDDVVAMAKPTQRSLTYLEAMEASGGPASARVARARHADPRLAQRLAEARHEVTRLQQEVHMAARRDDQREVERIDRLLQTAREKYDDLGVRFDRL